MRYMVRRSEVSVLGKIWWPMGPLYAKSITLGGRDLEDARDDEGALTRESVENWLGTHAGDFSEIVDFSASLEDGEQTVTIPWASEDHECDFFDAMYPAED